MNWNDNVIINTDEKRVTEFLLIYEEEFGRVPFDKNDPVRELWIAQFLREVPDGLLRELVVRTSEKIRKMRKDTINPKPRLNLFREVLAGLMKKKPVEPVKSKTIDRAQVVRTALADGVITDPGPCYECGSARRYSFNDDVGVGDWICIKCQLARFKNRGNPDV